ncbi:hypothetical protein F0562_010590 [Nyssa sinensis]|uniref:Bromo domain-containing protein n=1 Tax=Nyssa sinensis TaxID=561372 RepID=A0A5J5A109_9ASTE|nr:hypothetical protein F0562_010590 [Nyssa sinensis]
MASGTLDADDLREKHRWGEGNKVYTRKFHNKGLKNSTNNNSNTATDNNNNNNAAATTNNNNENKKNNTNNVLQQSSQTLAAENVNSSQQQQILLRLDAASDDSSSHNPPPQVSVSNGHEPPNGNGVIKPVITKVESRVRINMAAARSKYDIQDLRRMLESELDQVRSLVKKLEAKEVQLTGYSTSGGGYSRSQFSASDVINRVGLARANSEVGSVGHLDSRPFQQDVINRRGLVRANSEVGSVGRLDSRPFQQLSVQVMKNNHGIGQFVEKEKRTPKANQYYRNSDFLLGKERLPPPESNKKVKTNGGKKHGGEMGYRFRMDKYMGLALKSCSNLLTKLMKHKHAWVFNVPVDARALGLHDYHDIIKHPMDLGTVKSRLTKNWYKSPREFAEDVRLTFLNAMTYNPKGQDVHVMAEQLLKTFEEKWAVMEAEYNLDWRFEMVDVVGRTPVPKKPKAKDRDKRDMTFDEKQRLSTNLQSLPSEKLDSIVQIIKNSNSTLCQHDDEIEVDIDSVDAETLWELDRLVTNYKKSLSKKKRKAELALQARAEAIHAVPATNPALVVEAPKETKTGDTFEM